MNNRISALSSQLLALFVLCSCAPAPKSKALTGVPEPWKEFQLSVGGKPRTYFLSVPNSGRPPMPVLVFLHGLDTDLPNPEQTGAHYRFLAEKANQLGYLAVYPRGLAGASPALPRMLGWVGDPGREKANREFLAALVEELAAKRSIDRKRVVLGGFANGAEMAVKELLEQPAGPFTGFWLEAGGLADDRRTAAAREVFRPVVISIATNDWTRYEQARLLRDRLLRGGWENARTLRYAEHEGDHRLQEEGFESNWRFLTTRPT